MIKKIYPAFTLKHVLFIGALLPFLLMVNDILTDNFGANPVEELSNQSGLWALRFLLITLAISPARMVFKKLPLIKYRRMLGLFTFFYSTVHLLVFLVFDHALNGAYIVEAIVKSPAVDIGLVVYLMLIPLAVTSTNNMMRLMGRHWVKLHHTVHIAALLSIAHFIFSEKIDISIPLLYGAFLFCLQIMRIVLKKRKQKALLRLNLRHDGKA